MTKDDIIKLALESGFDEYDASCLSGDSEDDDLIAVGEYPVGETVLKFAAAVTAKAKEEVVPEGFVAVDIKLLEAASTAISEFGWRQTEVDIENRLDVIIAGAAHEKT